MFGFANYVRTPKPGVTPFSLPVAIGIIVVLSALDTVGCVVLIIGSFIFAKMGHKGLGIALALANCVVPDMLPGIDEVFGIVATGGTLITKKVKVCRIALFMPLMQKMFTATAARSMKIWMFYRLLKMLHLIMQRSQLIPTRCPYSREKRNWNRLNTCIS